MSINKQICKEINAIIDKKIAKMSQNEFDKILDGLNIPYEKIASKNFKVLRIPRDLNKKLSKTLDK